MNLQLSLCVFFFPTVLIHNENSSENKHEKVSDHGEELFSKVVLACLARPINARLSNVKVILYSMHTMCVQACNVILFEACLDVIRDQVILEESEFYHFVSLTATPAVAPVDNSNLGTT